MNVQSIITKLGGPANVGRHIGINSQAISIWIAKDVVPLERVDDLLQLAQAIDVPITAKEIRGDFDWDVVCSRCSGK